MCAKRLDEPLSCLYIVPTVRRTHNPDVVLFMYARMQSFILTVLFCALPTTSVHTQPRFALFEEFLNQHLSAIFPAEKDSLFAAFWRQARSQGIPWIDTNGTDVAFLYRGRADSVKVIGDFTNWSLKLKMRRIPETDLFYLRLAFERDARLDYRFIVNQKEVIDPFNPRVAPGVDGDRSELAMPEFQPSDEWKERRGVPKGTLAMLAVPKKSGVAEFSVLVYVPAGYDTIRTPMPTVYFFNGEAYLQYANAATILDNMIGAKAVPNTIGVFITETGRTAKLRNVLIDDSTFHFIATEIIPLVDRRFRTKTTSAARMVVGQYHGGARAFGFGFAYPHVVEYAAGQSPCLTCSNDTVLAMFRMAETRPLRLYVEIGTYEKNVGGFPWGVQEGNLYAAARTLRRILVEKGYPYQYKELHDGHSWARWRNELPTILRWFLTQRESP